nr:hypothetical protein [uncultured Methanospirillum sp.]
MADGNAEENTAHLIFKCILTSPNDTEESKIRDYLASQKTLKDKSNIRTHLEKLHLAGYIKKGPFKRGYPNVWAINVNRERPDNYHIIKYIVEITSPIRQSQYCTTGMPGFNDIINLPDIEILIRHMLGDKLSMIVPYADGQRQFTEIRRAAPSGSDIDPNIIETYKSALNCSLYLLHSLIDLNAAIIAYSRILTKSGIPEQYAILIACLSSDLVEVCCTYEMKIDEIISTCPVSIQDSWALMKSDILCYVNKVRVEGLPQIK